jgi:bifunctional non-homologous end joining protein LigD
MAQGRPEFVPGGSLCFHPNSSQKNMNPNESITLYFREGGSDKVYQVAIETRGQDYAVTFAYGRRGATLQTGTKTQFPVDYETAKLFYDRLVKEKLAKGYRPAEEQGSAYVAAGLQGEDTGIRCQLLNVADEDTLEELVRIPGWCAQEKHDGRRMLLGWIDGELVAINRRGLRTTVPEPIHAAAQALGRGFLLDGEAVGDTYHVFDLLEAFGRDIRPLSLRARLDFLADMLDGVDEEIIRWTCTARLRWEKEHLLESLRGHRREGIVFKHLDDPYVPGRPAAGQGPWKFKFVATASCLVAGVNDKRSVALALLDGDRSVSAGNVTIPPNHAVPAPGAIVEVRYLYAFPESGHLYQPVYRGERDDIDAADCTTAQLKFKPQSQKVA